MNKSGFTLIGILIVVMIIAALGYGSSFFFRGNKNDVSIKQNVDKQLQEIQQKNDEHNKLNSQALNDVETKINDLKTYKNDEYKFSFNYPSKLTINNLEKPEDFSRAYLNIGYLNIGLSEPDSRGKYYNMPIYFTVRKDISTFDPEKIMYPFSSKDMKISDVTIGVDKEKAKKVFFQINGEEGGQMITAYYIEKFGKLYELEYDYTSSTILIDDFENIISTFKFIN
jgi:type II secretory pathway pseudopilin PulG